MMRNETVLAVILTIVGTTVFLDWIDADLDHSAQPAVVERAVFPQPLPSIDQSMLIDAGGFVHWRHRMPDGERPLWRRALPRRLYGRISKPDAEPPVWLREFFGPGGGFQQLMPRQQQPQRRDPRMPQA